MRCSICHTTFDALDYLQDDLAEQPPELTTATEHEEDASQTEPEAEASTDATASSTEELEWVPEQESEPVTDTWEEIEPEPSDSEDDSRAAAFLPTNKPRRPKRIWLWGILSFLAATALLTQWAWYTFPAWSQNPNMRPAMERVCGRLNELFSYRCDLPPLADLAALRLIDYEFTSHPNREDGLYFRAILVNDAEFSQPYPLVFISMDDVWGETVAVGHFGAADYLDEPLGANAGISPHAQVPIRLELKDPGAQATGFRFDLQSLP